MTVTIMRYGFLLLCIVLLPSITFGIIRKLKARMQNRIGASVFQPLFDIIKLIKKDQTISETTTWIFLLSSSVNFGIILLIAWLVPWLSFKPDFPGDDLFLLLYALALLRFMTILASLDTGSPFGAFGASREAYLSMLAEPVMFMSLGAAGLVAHTTDLSDIFSFGHTCTLFAAPAWLGAALGIYMASFVDLSRMPIDDPTTHLELTMVHEAMTLENSGRNLALVEFSHQLRMVVLYGLTSQCLMHAASALIPFSELSLGVSSVIGILGLACLTAAVEALSVKLQWRRTPEFIAYALTFSLFAMASALIGGLYANHRL